jgi:hypothetical protein
MTTGRLAVRLRNWGALSLAVLELGCASVRTNVTIREDVLEPTRTSYPLPQKSHRFVAIASGTDLILHAEVEQLCQSRTQQNVHRWRDTERTLHPSGYVTTALVVSALCMGSGAWLYADADELARKQQEEGEEASPDAYRGVGAALGVVGVGAAVAAVVAAVQATDEHEDLGIVEKPAQVSVHACATYPAAGLVAEVRVGSHAWTARADAEGTIRVSMLGVPPEDVPSVDRPGVILVPDGEPASFALDSSSQARLARALALAPASSAPPVPSTGQWSPEVTAREAAGPLPPPPAPLPELPPPPPRPSSPAAAKVHDTIASCKGQGTPGDQSRATTAYLYASRAPRAERAILDAEIEQACGVSRSAVQK